jgi:hypothetical protein
MRSELATGIDLCVGFFALAQAICGIIVSVYLSTYPGTFLMKYPHTLDRLNGQWDWAPLNYVKLADQGSLNCELDEEEVFFYTRG